MANPLLNKMSQAIVGQQMQNNPMFNIVNMFRSGGNPQSILNALSKNNPQAGKQLQDMLNSGQSPEQLVKSMLDGRSSLEIQNMRNTMTQLGMPQEMADKIFSGVKSK